MSQDAVYSNPNIPDSKEKAEQLNTYVLYLGVCFDGTNNSRWNIDEYQHYKNNVKATDKRDKFYKDSSFVEDYSNVAKFSQSFGKIKDGLAKKMYSHVYITGIGTSNRIGFNPDNFDINDESNADSTGGQAHGRGNTGVRAKVSRGCMLATIEIFHLLDYVFPGKVINLEVHLIITGFSRGATAARRFANCVFSPQGESDKHYNECLATNLKADLKRKDIKHLKCNQIKVSIDFLGLFDTVSSYGIVDMLDSSVFMTQCNTSDVKELGLKIDSNSAKKVFQICAADEYRRHFALTRAEAGEEYIIPGCHSDIGGGYVDDKKEEWEINGRFDFAKWGVIPYLVKNGFNMHYNGHKLKNELLDEGWFSEKDIENGFRKVSNKYSIIPFLLMKKEMVNAVGEPENLLLPNTTNLDFDSVVSEKCPDSWSKIKSAIMSKTQFYSFEKRSPFLSYRKGLFQISSFKENGPIQKKQIQEVRHYLLHLSSRRDYKLVQWESPDNIRWVVPG